jgi:hypothetical protein
MRLAPRVWPTPPLGWVFVWRNAARKTKPNSGFLPPKWQVFFASLAQASLDWR